jgi:hypothetical protein
MSRIIEFSHPGLQLNLGKRGKKNGIAYSLTSNTNGIRYWNNENTHYRKFISNKGSYLVDLDSTPGNGDLLFWCEWEPQSYFSLTNKSGKLNPNAIHEPFISMNGVGVHNTDPFVFGLDFYYSNCKQKRNNMTNLNSGDLILFGSEYDEGFALDTVFIVRGSNTAKEYQKNPNTFPPLLRQATLDLNNLYQHNSDLKLYHGEMYYSSPKGIFSFFPCRLKTGGPFQRPLLEYGKFKLQSPGARTVLHDIDYNSVTSFWNDLVTEILNQGYFLGIQADMPPTKNKMKFSKVKKGKGC